MVCGGVLSFWFRNFRRWVFRRWRESVYFLVVVSWGSDVLVEESVVVDFLVVVESLDFLGVEIECLDFLVLEGKTLDQTVQCQIELWQFWLMMFWVWILIWGVRFIQKFPRVTAGSNSMSKSSKVYGEGFSIG